MSRRSKKGVYPALRHKQDIFIGTTKKYRDEWDRIFSKKEDSEKPEK